MASLQADWSRSTDLEIVDKMVYAYLSYPIYPGIRASEFWSEEPIVDKMD